jgi:hypothetical protein
MNRVSSQLAAVLMLSAALVLGGATAFAQSSGGSSGGPSGGSAGGGASSAGASRGGGSAGSVGRAGGAGAGTPGAPAPRVGGTPTGVDSGTTVANPMLRSDPSGATRTGTPSTSDPRSLSNQPGAAAPGSTAPGTYSAGGTPAPAGTTTPSGTAYPAGEALGGARQRALQSPSGTAIPPAATGLGTDSSGNATTDQATPGLPNTADPNRGSTSTSGDPSRLAGGGRANREGARGANMQDCEAAWDEKTHMSKDKWRETCHRTLTDPHL